MNELRRLHGKLLKFKVKIDWSKVKKVDEAWVESEGKCSLIVVLHYMGKSYSFCVATTKKSQFLFKCGPKVLTQRLAKAFERRYTSDIKFESQLNKDYMNLLKKEIRDVA